MITRILRYGIISIVVASCTIGHRSIAKTGGYAVIEVTTGHYLYGCESMSAVSQMPGWFYTPEDSTLSYIFLGDAQAMLDSMRIKPAKIKKLKDGTMIYKYGGIPHLDVYVKNARVFKIEIFDVFLIVE